MRSVTKFVLIFWLIQTSAVLADGYWEQVRKADWEFPLEKVFFVNENRGWILGMHRELLCTGDGGENWTSFNFPDEIKQRITGYLEDIFFINETIGWIVGDEGIILKTSDKGVSWIFIETNIIEDLNACWFVDELHGWVVGYDGIIFNTTDGGESWFQQMRDPDQWWFTDVCFVDSTTGWVVSRKGSIFNTDDGGATWHRQFSNEENSFLSVFFIDENIGWASGKNDGVLVHTDDGGLNWQLVELPMNTSVINSLFFVNGDFGWATTGGNGLLFHTSNGGDDWITQKCPTLNRMESVFFLDEKKGWAVGFAGTIFHTVDGGNSWQSQVKATGENLCVVSFGDSMNGWAIGAASLIHTTDGGKTWDFIEDMEGNDISFVDEKTGWIVHAGEGIYHTTDGGESWHKQTINADRRGIYDCFFLNRQIGWVVTSDSSGSTIFNTTNSGEVWDCQAQLDYEVDIFFVDSLNGWAAGNALAIYHTSDGGWNWELQMIGQASIFIAFMDLFFVDNNTGWTISYEGDIYHTTNGGQNWYKQYSNPLNFGSMAIHFLDNNEGWAVSAYGAILHTTDGGQHWDTSYLSYGWNDVFFTDRQHGWITGDYGAVLRWVDETSVNETAGSTLPSTIELLQNYPNPFNPTTKICYHLPEAAPVKLEIYNLLGQKIITLKDEQQPAGQHTVRWDGRDETGAAVSSGVYLYTLTAGRFCGTRKMVVMR